MIANVLQLGKYIRLQWENSLKIFPNVLFFKKTFPNVAILINLNSGA